MTGRRNMNRLIIIKIAASIVPFALAVTSIPNQLRAQNVSIDPATMPRIGAIDERFQSYNIEMAEVTGGSFWKPYKGQGSKKTAATPSMPKSHSIPAGMDPSLYQYRPPIDLSNARLRKLAAALGPAYVRVSGTWANSIYFADTETAPAKAPSGFSGVLTRKQWKGVIDFAHSVNAQIVTSLATSVGTRDANGVWTPKQAKEWLAYTKSMGGEIAASEFMNEPTYAAMGGAPKGYNAADYGRDIAVFGPWLKKNSPGTLFLGPGSVGEGPFAMAMGSGMLKTEDLLKATGPVFDVFSYHLYAAASKRCAAVGEKMQTTAEAALSRDWLSRPERIGAFYAGLRDQSEPDKPLWITETADAACGGNPWASTFLDTFRYLIEHGSLAQRGVKVIMHNTLASSDYGLLDQDTFEPRPNYWATLLWHKLMGTTVLDPKISPVANVYTYAQCLRDKPGGVALLIINADRQRGFDINLNGTAARYTLTAKPVQSKEVLLNRSELRLTSNGELPELRGEPVKAGRVSFAALSITYLALPTANNASCK
jgi:heparanase